MAGAYLAHHGVKGMRWGVRKKHSASGGNSSSGGSSSSGRAGSGKKRGSSSKKWRRVKRGLKTVGGISISVAAAYLTARHMGIDQRINSVMAQSYSSAARNTHTVRRGRDALNFRNKIDPMLDFRQTL